MLHYKIPLSNTLSFGTRRHFRCSQSTRYFIPNLLCVGYLIHRCLQAIIYRSPCLHNVHTTHVRFLARYNRGERTVQQHSVRSILLPALVPKLIYMRYGLWMCCCLISSFDDGIDLSINRYTIDS